MNNSNIQPRCDMSWTPSGGSFKSILFKSRHNYITPQGLNPLQGSGKSQTECRQKKDPSFETGSYMMTAKKTADDKSTTRV